MLGGSLNLNNLSIAGMLHGPSQKEPSKKDEGPYNLYIYIAMNFSKSICKASRICGQVVLKVSMIYTKSIPKCQVVFGQVFFKNI